MNDDDLLRVWDLCNRGKGQTRGLLGVGRTALYGMLDRDEFPKPIRLGRVPVWRRGDIRAWLEAKKVA